MNTKESGVTIKHEGIAATLHAQIKRGEFKDRLPSRGNLARSFGVAFKTLDKALYALRKERIVQLRKGVGVFVHPSIRGQVVGECYFVFPGHKALTDATNPSRGLTLHILEELLNSAHELHAEVRLLAISPLNNEEINWTLLTHLKRDDYVIFLGLQYWNIIEALTKKGCRCLMLSAHPATQGLVADGMSLMTFDIEYIEMMDRLAEYFAGCGCRHPAVVGPKAHFSGRLWTSLFERLSRECRRRGIAFTVQDVAKLSMSEDSLMEFCAQVLPSSSRPAGAGGLPPSLQKLWRTRRRTSRGTSRDETPVDGIFTVTDEEARQVRAVLDKHFPSVSRSLPVVCFDLRHTWQSNDLAIDALRKPHADMARSLMAVVCGKEPFEPKDKVFPFCEVALSTQECAEQPVSAGLEQEGGRQRAIAG